MVLGDGAAEQIQSLIHSLPEISSSVTPLRSEKDESVATTNEEAATLGSRISRHIAMVSICPVMFITFMDMTIVSVALPRSWR